MRCNPEKSHWQSETRTCPGCPENGPQPLENFFVCKARPNGRTSQCKVCVIVVQDARRKGKKVERKPCHRTRIIWKMKLKPRDAVLLAIRRGARTQKEINRMTRLLPDLLTDALAELWSENKLDRDALRRREYRIVA